MAGLPDPNQTQSHFSATFHCGVPHVHGGPRPSSLAALAGSPGWRIHGHRRRWRIQYGAGPGHRRQDAPHCQQTPRDRRRQCAQRCRIRAPAQHRLVSDPVADSQFADSPSRLVRLTVLCDCFIPHGSNGAHGKTSSSEAWPDLLWPPWDGLRLPMDWTGWPAYCLS